MDETLQEEVHDLIADINKEVDSAGGIWEVDPSRLAACQLNILWASVGGYRFDPHSPEVKRHLELNSRVMESLGPKNMLAAFPFLKMLPVLSGYREHCEIQRDIREFMLVGTLTKLAAWILSLSVAHYFVLKFPFRN